MTPEEFVAVTAKFCEVNGLNDIVSDVAAMMIEALLRLPPDLREKYFAGVMEKTDEAIAADFASGGIVPPEQADMLRISILAQAELMTAMCMLEPAGNA